MYRRVGKIDLIRLCGRSGGIHNYKNCTVAINRHYQCGDQGVYGFRRKQMPPFKCELIFFYLPIGCCDRSGKLCEVLIELSAIDMRKRRFGYVIVMLRAFISHIRIRLLKWSICNLHCIQMPYKRLSGLVGSGARAKKNDKTNNRNRCDVAIAVYIPTAWGLISRKLKVAITRMTSQILLLTHGRNAHTVGLILNVFFSLLFVYVHSGRWRSSHSTRAKQFFAMGWRVSKTFASYGTNESNWNPCSGKVCTNSPSLCPLIHSPKQSSFHAVASTSWTCNDMD